MASPSGSRLLTSYSHFTLLASRDITCSDIKTCQISWRGFHFFIIQQLICARRQIQSRHCNIAALVYRRNRYQPEKQKKRRNDIQSKTHSIPSALQRIPLNQPANWFQRWKWKGALALNLDVL